MIVCHHGGSLLSLTLLRGTGADVVSCSLGSFARFEDDYRAMVFENGQHCWSGPNRSIRVCFWSSKTNTKTQTLV